MNEEKTEVEASSDLEFFENAIEESQDRPRVAREIARQDFLRVLRTWKVLRKARRRFNSNDKDIKQATLESLEMIIDAIVDGDLVVENDGATGVKLVHNLNVPLSDDISQLVYKRAPKIKDLRKMDQFEEQEKIAQSQAMAAALSGRSVAELANLSGADLDLFGSIVNFTV